MANKEIGGLTAAGAVTGSETVHVVQSGNSRRMTISAIADWLLSNPTFTGSSTLNDAVSDAGSETIADDAFATITPTSGRTCGWLTMRVRSGSTPETEARYFGFIRFDATQAGRSVNLGSVTLINTTTTTPTGTTTTNGRIALYVGGADGSFYFENRLGGTVTVEWSLR